MLFSEKQTGEDHPERARLQLLRRQSKVFGRRRWGRRRRELRCHPVGQDGEVGTRRKEGEQQPPLTNSDRKGFAVEAK